MSEQYCSSCLWPVEACRCGEAAQPVAEVVSAPPAPSVDTTLPVGTRVRIREGITSAQWEDIDIDDGLDAGEVGTIVGAYSMNNAYGGTYQVNIAGEWWHLRPEMLELAPAPSAPAGASWYCGYVDSDGEVCDSTSFYAWINGSVRVPASVALKVDASGDRPYVDRDDDDCDPYDTDWDTWESSGEDPESITCSTCDSEYYYDSEQYLAAIRIISESGYGGYA